MDMTFWLPQTEAALAQLPVFCATKRGNERP